jgi:DNA-binding NarL/FixJ family response regulator
MQPTVAIIASERHARERCARLLADGGLHAVASATDPRELAQLADITVVVGDAPEPATAIAQARQALPGSRLVAVVPSITRHVVRRCIRAGAAAMVRHENIEQSLLIAVQSAGTGQLSIPLDFADGLEKPALSSREKQILGMVVMGFTNGQIGRRLFLAESTVKSHMSSIFAKLGVSSRMEAAALVLDPEEGLGMGILCMSENPLGMDTGAVSRPGDRAVTAA